MRISFESTVRTLDALYEKIPFRTPLVVLFLCGVILLMLWRNDWTPWDFSLFYASGEAFLDGRPPYEPNAVPELDIEPGLNRNPPFWLLLFGPLSLLPFWTAHAVMLANVVIAYTLNAALLLRNGMSALRRPLVLLWLASLTGFWRALGQAQIHVLLALVATGAYFNLHKRPALAGALIGFLASSKPNFVIWPVFLLLAGDRRIVLTSVLAAVATVLLSFALGLHLPIDFVNSMVGVEAATIAMSSSLSGNLAKIGVTGLETEVAIMIVAPLAALVWWSKASFEEASGLALAAAPLASPLAWPAYTLFLLPVLFSRPWAWPERVLAGLMVVPLAALPILRELAGTASCAAFLTVVAIVGVPMIRRQLGETRLSEMPLPDKLG